MDVLQEGFLKVFNSLDKFTGVGTFEGWMRRIMVNLSIDRYRRLKNDWILLGDENGIENIGDEGTDGLEEADEHDEIYNITPEQIIDAMQQLTPAYRTVFNLYVYEDYTHQDIAEALGISVGSSKSNYAKAKKNMKKLLLKHLQATK
jgi:RNA polymerase sigma-70 factor (ECF subfamily)